MDFGHPDEYAHIQKSILRDFIRINGWRRCGRTKKMEVYKKKINGEQYRIKFSTYGPSLDRQIPRTEYSKSYWTMVSNMRWTNIEDMSDLSFLSNLMDIPSKVVLTEEEQDCKDYLYRLGVPA